MHFTKTQLHDQITELFFAADVTTHILLVADQNLPTTLSNQNISKQSVLSHLHQLESHFNSACKAMKSPRHRDMNLTGQI